MYDNFALQKHIRDRVDLKLVEKAVALILTTYRNSTTGACFPSQQMLATQSSCSLKHINEIIRSLKKKKVLTASKARFNHTRKRTVTNYVFLFDKTAKSNP